MSAKNLKIDHLDLDLLNPRISKASDQREAIQRVIHDQDLKLSTIPFILHAAKLRERTGTAFSGGIPTSEEPLPAIVETGLPGYVLSRETRVTFIQRETTDDN
jgi:hypothetical protein